MLLVLNFQKGAGSLPVGDDDHFCTLEAVALQLGAKECLIPKVGLVWIWLLTQNNPFASPIRIHCIFPSFSVPLSYSLLQATEAGNSQLPDKPGTLKRPAEQMQPCGD